MKISKILAGYNTDKNVDERGGHCYGKVYDHLFKSFHRLDKLNIIEIGTEKGWSLIAWKDYFRNAVVTGVDIKNVVEDKRVNINYIWSDVKDMKPNEEFDIVIDDGSHKLSDVIHVVRNFKLKVGGIMVIEDCQAPNHWYEKIKRNTNYSVETIDLRNVNKQRDDFLIVLRNYGYVNLNSHIKPWDTITCPKCGRKFYDVGFSQANGEPTMTIRDYLKMMCPCKKIH